MSRLDAFLKGLEFRTSRPEYDAGDELDVIVTGREAGEAVVRIGDTKLFVADGHLSVDDEVRIRVTEFDDDRSVGRAELL